MGFCEANIIVNKHTSVQEVLGVMNKMYTKKTFGC